jgi:hypothetical protein
MQEAAPKRSISGFAPAAAGSTPVAKVPFAEHDHMVDALAADRAYQPFRISTLPRMIAAR